MAQCVKTYTFLTYRGPTIYSHSAYISTRPWITCVQKHHALEMCLGIDEGDGGW